MQNPDDECVIGGFVSIPGTEVQFYVILTLVVVSSMQIIWEVARINSLVAIRLLYSAVRTNRERRSREP